jgi:uncharacterized YccA/Bax inhibitor family protein
MSNPMLHPATFTARTSDTVPTSTMTVGGVVSATATLFALFTAAAVWGWTEAVTAPFADNPSLPTWMTGAVIAGFATAFIARFVPRTAVVLGPAYALIQGAVVGAVSHYTHERFDGVVIQAVGATAGVFVAVLTLYATGLIKVTRRFAFTTVALTGGIAVYYIGSMIADRFGAETPLIHSTSVAGIAFTFLAALLAAANLAVDFNAVARGVEANAPKHMEWFAALGTVITVVWLYLELLKLFSKLRSR